MSDLDAALEAFKAAASVPLKVPPPREEWVRDAEEHLGHRLPSSYTRFLRECGSKTLLFWDVYRVVDPAKRPRVFDIVRANLQERSEVSNVLPEFLIAFHNNGLGDQTCFDTRRVRRDGECPVVLWEHDASPGENSWAVEHPLWDSFAEWLQAELDGRDEE